MLISVNLGSIYRELVDFKKSNKVPPIAFQPSEKIERQMWRKIAYDNLSYANYKKSSCLSTTSFIFALPKKWGTNLKREVLTPILVLLIVNSVTSKKL